MSCGTFRPYTQWYCSHLTGSHDHVNYRLKLVISYRTKPYAGLQNVWVNGLTCHMLVLVFLTGSILNVGAKLENQATEIRLAFKVSQRLK